jgi:hypothetical protein
MLAPIVLARLALYILPNHLKPFRLIMESQSLLGP